MATNWFPHDSSAHNDQRVLLVREKYGWQGYGIFWAILEAMYETADGRLDTDVLRALYVRFSVEKEWLLEFIRFCVNVKLFAEADGTVYSERLVEEKLRMVEKSEQAKKAIESRWKKRRSKPSDTDVSPPNDSSNTPPHPTEPPPPDQERMAAGAALPVAEVIDDKEGEFRKFVPFAAKVLGRKKKFTPEALEKWRARRRKFSAVEIGEAFQNLQREPDHWKIRNNGHRELSWWLKSDDRIREMQNCHEKGGPGLTVIPG